MKQQLRKQVPQGMPGENPSTIIQASKISTVRDTQGAFSLRGRRGEAHRRSSSRCAGGAGEGRRGLGCGVNMYGPNGIEVVKTQGFSYSNLPLNRSLINLGVLFEEV